MDISEKKPSYFPFLWGGGQNSSPLFKPMIDIGRCINNSFCQIVFTKLEVPDIFRGLQCSIYCKDNSSSEEGWANGSPKENIYEEFKRYDTRHGSKKIKNPEKFADVNNKFNRNDIRQGSKKIKSPKKTADTKNKFQTQNEKFSPDSTSKIVVNKVQI